MSEKCQQATSQAWDAMKRPPTEAAFSYMVRFYISLFGFVPFAPPVLAILGGITSLQLSRRRWIVHTITLVAMIFALPIYIYFLGVLEPTSIQYPGPGDGFVALLYLVILLPTTLVYSVFSFFTRTRTGQTRPLQKSN
jgi:hypothetical protein